MEGLRIWVASPEGQKKKREITPLVGRWSVGWGHENGRESN